MRRKRRGNVRKEGVVMCPRKESMHQKETQEKKKRDRRTATATTLTTTNRSRCPPKSERAQAIHRTVCGCICGRRADEQEVPAGHAQARTEQRENSERHMIHGKLQQHTKRSPEALFVSFWLSEPYKLAPGRGPRSSLLFLQTPVTPFLQEGDIELAHFVPLRSDTCSLQPGAGGEKKKRGHKKGRCKIGGRLETGDKNGDSLSLFGSPALA